MSNILVACPISSNQAHDALACCCWFHFFFAVSSLLELPKYNCTDLEVKEGSFKGFISHHDNGMWFLDQHVSSQLDQSLWSLDVDFCCLPCLSHVQAGLQIWYNNFQFLGYSCCCFFFHSSRAWGVVAKPSTCRKTDTTGNNSCRGFQFVTSDSAQSVRAGTHKIFAP